MAGNRVISAVLTLKDKDFSTNAKKSASAIKELEQKTKHSSNAVKAFGKSAAAEFKGIAKAAAGLTAGFVAVRGIKDLFGSSIKTFADFEQGMANVKAVSGVTGEDFKRLEAKAREMGRATSKTAAESADGLQYLALAGWDTEQMLKGIEPVLRLSEAGALDLGRASDLVTDSMAALGIGVDGLDGFLDQVAQTSRRSNTNVDALMEAFLVAGGTMKTFNVPMEEANALLGIMANRGYKGSEAGTALNAIVSNLTSGLGASGKAMDQLGISAFDSKGNFKGLENVFTEVKGKLDKMTDAEKAQYISMIAGKEHMKTFTGIMDGLGNEYGALKKEVQGADGALMEMADTQLDTFQGSMKLMESAIDDVKITLGQGLAPILREVADFIASKMPTIQQYVQDAVAKIPAMKDKFIEMYNSAQPALSWLSDTALPAVRDAISFVVEKVKQFSDFVINNWGLIAPVVAGIAGGLITLQVGIVAVSAVTKTWAAVTTAVQIATAILNGTLALSPLGWIALAIGAVVAISVVLYKNWDTVTSTVGKLWDKLLDNPLSALIAGPFGALVAIGVTLYKNFDKIKESFSSFKSAITSFEMPGWVKSIGGVFTGAVGAVGKLKNAVTGSTTTTADLAKAGMPAASYAVGTNRVPNDMLANIHKDEMIIPARQAANLRRNGVTIDNVDKPRTTTTNTSQNSNVFNININAKDKSANDIINELVPQLKLRLANL